MYKALKFGVYTGLVVFLAGCSASEHFMQDDVYNTRTPIMPPGTDLNDVTDYATFVAKKEQTEVPQERTAYVSPRQYYDYFYYSRLQYYGYSPFASLSGIGYYGYGNYHYPVGYGYGNNFYPSMGYSYWNYNMIGFGSYYGAGNNPYNYYGYNGWGNPYAGGFYAPYGHSSAGKPNTAGNLAHNSAKISGGRGSNTAPAGYPHQIMANPGSTIRTEGNSTVRTGNTAPIVTSTGRATAPVTRGVQPTRPINAGNPAVRPQNAGTEQRRSTPGSSERVARPTINNSNNNNTPSRTTAPSTRGSGSSGGGTPSSGGSRSGGRR